MQNSNNSTIPNVFKAAVLKYGDRVAMRKKAYGLWHDISWNEYFQQTQRIASALISMGLEKGDCVSIIGDNCPEWVFINMSVQCAGGIVAGIYATNAWQQVEYVVSHSDSRFLFVENEEQLDKWLMFRENTPGLKKVIVWDTEGLRHFKDPAVLAYEELTESGKAVTLSRPGMVEARIKKIKPEDVALLIYTSGTTGPPKGVMLTQANLTWMGGAITSNNPMYDTDEVLSFLPLCHVFEQLFSVMGHIAVGYTVNFIETLDTVTDNMIEISPTVAHGVARV